MRGIKKIRGWEKRVGVTRPDPPRPRFLSSPPPPYFNRLIIGHGLPVEYQEADDGEHYLKNGVYHFRPLNPANQPKSEISDLRSPISDPKSMNSISDPKSTLNLTTGPLLSVKELAWQLRRHPSYVYAMRQAGFEMPGYRTTLTAALDWLANNPNWRQRL